MLALEMRDLMAEGYDVGLTGFDLGDIDELLATLDATEPRTSPRVPPKNMSSRSSAPVSARSSEVVDAFTVSSWNQSKCVCGRMHRETCFIFPPMGLERTVVRRARSDGVKAVFVVPTAYKAGFWMALRNHAIDSFELTKPDSDFANAQAPLGKHTVFLVDFGGPDANSPPCGQEAERRGRRPLLNVIEAEERLRVQAELQRLAEEAHPRGKSVLREASA
jgi:hypothetical protein